MDDLSELKAKAEQGNADAQYALAERYYREWDASETSSLDPRLETAQKWYELAAKQGHPGAQFCLAGLVLDEDYGGDPTGESLRWYRAAAEQGHAEACMSLCYYILEYGDHNEREAIKWYRRARELGHPHDPEYFGFYGPYHMYLSRGSERHRKYAEAGDRQAQHYIGKLYLTGKDYGYPLNFIHAYAWCAAAAKYVPGDTVEELHEQGSNWTERQTPEGIIRLLEHIFDEDERDQAHRLALVVSEKFGRKQVLRLKIFDLRERLEAYWQLSVVVLSIVSIPVLALLLLYLLWTAVVAVWR